MRIRAHPLMILYGLVLAVCASWRVLLCTLAALAIHEAGHWLAGRLAGDVMRSVELTPFGGVITYGESPHKGLRGVAVAAAGPLSNYLAILLVPAISGVWDAGITRAFLQANLAILCVNLLPVLPLDGGRMIFNVGYYVFPVSGLITLLTGLGIAAGAAMLGLSVYGYRLLGRLNASLVIVGIYLMICAARSRQTMLAENLFAVVQERCGQQQGVRRIRLYRVAAQAPLYTLLEPMQRTQACAFVYADEAGEHVLGERQLCLALLRDPMAAINQAWEADTSKMGETAAKSQISP